MVSGTGEVRAYTDPAWDVFGNGSWGAGSASHGPCKYIAWGRSDSIQGEHASGVVKIVAAGTVVADGGDVGVAVMMMMVVFVDALEEFVTHCLGVGECDQGLLIRSICAVGGRVLRAISAAKDGEVC